ncbi:RdRP-domain-containing protein [Lentinula raphanica]|nr:RdRP-domain-containing protein [Lentinula raphanica]
MDIFVSNIPAFVDKEQLLTEFHRIIHRSPFRTDPLLNFDIFLFKIVKDGKRNAILTLPTAADGRLLLQIYPSTPIRLSQTVISCRPGNRPPRENTLARIRSQAWQDPETIRQEKEHERSVSQPTSILSMSFGRLRRDGTFTVEQSFNGKIHCDPQQRRLVVTLASGDSSRPRNILDTYDLAEMLEHLGYQPETVSFFYASSSVQAVIHSSSGDQNELFMEFSHPATFEKTSPGIFGRDGLPNQRLTGLPGAISAPLASQVLRVAFTSTIDLLHFVTRARNVQLPHAKRLEVQTIDARVHNRNKHDELANFMKSLPFPLAFQLEKSVWDAIIEPSELYESTMKQAILNIQEDHPDSAAKLFRYFVSTLQVSTFREPPRPPPRRREVPDHMLSKSARRRRRRKNRRLQEGLGPSESTASVLHEQLIQAAKDYVQDMQRPHRRYESAPNPALYEAYHVAITPSRQVLEGPLPDLSNGIVRLYQDYQDCFIRVSFQDEDGGKPRREPNLAIDDLLDKRYKPVLLDGIDIGGRHFEFLGYSMSSLKDYTFIFVTPFRRNGELVNAERIRKGFGNITKALYRPALLGARWGQMFSASMPSIRLEPSQLVKIDDIMSSNAVGQNAVFSDGCSPAAPDLMRAVARILAPSSKIIPSCFQFRLGGAKGVFYSDPQLSGSILCLRPSQTKFESPDMNLDITLSSSRPLALFLNRPLIALLEHHGVPKPNFIKFQDMAIQDTQRIRHSLVEAATVFAQHGLGTSFQLESLFRNIGQILHLEIAQHVSDTDDNTAQLVILKIAIAHGITHILREIKHRSRIRVPGSYTLLGICDEWNCLEEGEIFAQIFDPRTQKQEQIEGRVLITRSPQIHPGDCQFVEAVYREELAHLKNVVVFSCKGDRSLPSMLGGGDLDGDIYNLILEDAFHPPKPYTAQAGAYMPLQPTVTPHPCGVKDVVDFVINYIKSDLVGYISTLHLRISDLNGLDCADCLKLAEAASHAVDFPKVGTAVNFKDLPKPPNGPRPDYLSGEGYRPRPGDDRHYPSSKILGELFRRVPTDEYEFEEEDWSQPIDFDKIDGAIRLAAARCQRRLRSSRFGAFHAALNMSPESDLLDEMYHVFEDYREELVIIAKTHTASKKADVWLTEEELICGVIMERYHDHKRRREVMTAMNLQTQELTRKIRHEFSSRDQDAFDEDEDFDAISYEEDPDIERLCNQFNRARAAWIVGNEEDAFGASSFAMIALGSMLNAIKSLGREMNVHST